MKMKKLINAKNNGKELIEIAKNEFEHIYKTLTKEELLKVLIENNQKELLTKINFEIVKDNYENDMRFIEHHENEIIRILNEDLNFDNLEFEFELYKNKVKLLGEECKDWNYKQVIEYELDYSKMEYEKDFNLMLKLVKTIKNIYLWGNAGNGKTTFAYNISEALGLDLYNINSVKNEYSVKGFFDLNGKYELSLYEKWYKNGGVLLLDEVDTYSSNGMLYLNNGIEINSKYLTLENGEKIEKHKDCYVIACANTNGDGKTSDFIGRNAIDKAFMSRFTKKEFKEYAYIHKQILGEENYKKVKKYFDKKGIELTCRLCVKIKKLNELFKINEIIEMLDNKEFEI